MIAVIRRMNPSGACEAGPATMTSPTASDDTCAGAGAGHVNDESVTEPSALSVVEDRTSEPTAVVTVGVTGDAELIGRPVPALLVAATANV